MSYNMPHLYSEGLLTPHPNTNMEDHLFSVVCDYSLNILSAILHI